MEVDCDESGCQIVACDKNKAVEVSAQRAKDPLKCLKIPFDAAVADLLLSRSLILVSGATFIASGSGISAKIA